MTRQLAALSLLALSLAASPSVAGEQVKVGVVKGTVVGDLKIALARDYFAAEGLSVEAVDFESAQPVAVATASGDIDFGSVGLTAGFYSLAGQGVLKIVSGSARDIFGYHTGAYLVSNAAFDSDMTSFKEWTGRKIAITQVGSPYHYSLALLAAKYGLDLKALQIAPVQSVPNELSAIAGGTADAALVPVGAAMSLVNRGAAHLVGFTGDEAPWQFSVVFASAKTVSTRHAMVKHFLAALHRGGADYHAAFSGPHDERQDGPTAPAIEDLLAKSTNQPVAQIKLSLAFIDAQGRLDEQDVANQIALYRTQGMVKGDFTVAGIIDNRLVAPVR